MRSAAMGFGVLFTTIFVFFSMANLMQNNIIYQETNSALNEAVYQTGCFLQDENNSVTNNEDFKKVFINFLKPQLSHPEDYTVSFYETDYENGLMDVGITNTVKECSARRTIIIDGKEEE